MEGHDILNTFLRFRDQLSIVISTSMMMDALCVVNRTALLRITKCTRVKRHCSHRTGLLLAGISQVFADLHGWGNFPDGGRREDL